MELNSFLKETDWVDKYLQPDGNGNITLSADSNKLYLYEKRQLAIKYIKENASIVPDGVLKVKIPNILNNI